VRWLEELLRVLFLLVVWRASGHATLLLRHLILR
jgi:hypothetical protein